MTTFAVIQGGTVANIVVWDGDPASWPDAAKTHLIEITEATGICAIGYVYNGAVFVAPGVPTPSLPEAPRVVTMRQARLALLSSGYLAGVASVLEALPSPQKEAAQIEWEFAATVERDSQLVALLASSLELDENALDRLFLDASAR